MEVGWWYIDYSVYLFICLKFSTIKWDKGHEISLYWKIPTEDSESPVLLLRECPSCSLSGTMNAPAARRARTPPSRPPLCRPPEPAPPAPGLPALQFCEGFSLTSGTSAGGWADWSCAAPTLFALNTLPSLTKGRKGTHFLWSRP